MAVHLKPLAEQTIVLTGATSGIGLATARLAAARGAHLLLAARGDDALRELTGEFVAAGSRAVFVVADVGNPADVAVIARTAIETFGGCDTWINNAGVSIYGTLDEIPTAEMRRLFDTNFWGVVYGSLAAVQLLRPRGGALINMGSGLSERAVVLQGIYGASKHAIAGFTEALRIELEADGTPISVTLVEPGAIDTPTAQHAKNYLAAEPRLPPLRYAPQVAAEAILHCAEHPKRTLVIGAEGEALALAGRVAPRLTDKVMELVGYRAQRTDGPPGARFWNGLDHTMGNLQERGEDQSLTMESSPYTQATLHPLRTGAAVAGAGIAATVLWRRHVRATEGR